MELNDEQRQAVESNSNKLLVMAGAGAGKTASMLERIVRLVNEGAKPSSILVLTFTNAAAVSMKQKYKMKQMKGEIPEFRTFHSFCYSLIIKDEKVRSAIGYSKVPKVADESKENWIKRNALQQSGLPASLLKYSYNDDMDKKTRGNFELFQKAVKRICKKDNYITFDILCYDICNLFITDDKSIQKYKKQYKYLFVDEFQDTDDTQLRFVNSFKDINWYFTGDALQNIYQFRGCSNKWFKQLSVDPDWEKIKLYKNYRSTRSICKYSNSKTKYAEDSYRIEMQGQRDGDFVHTISGSRCTKYEQVDRDHLRILIEKLKEGVEDAAVLCRTNKEVAEVVDALSRNGISCNSSQNKNEYNNLFMAVIDDDYMLSWLSTFLNSDMYTDYIRSAAQEKNPDIIWFSKKYGYLEPIKTRGKLIINIRKVAKDPHLATKDKINDILTLVDKSLIGKIETPDTDKPEEIIKYIMNSIGKLNSGSVYVGTIHSVKGLEYDSVYVMGVNDFHFKLNSEENKNVFYVAITRAKNHLTVFTA